PPRRRVHRRQQAGEHPGRGRRPPVSDRLPDRVAVRVARRSRARSVLAGEAATRGPVPRAQAQATVCPRVDDAGRAGQCPSAQLPDPSAPPDQPALSHGTPADSPMAAANRPGPVLGKQLASAATAHTQREGVRLYWATLLSIVL